MNEDGVHSDFNLHNLFFHNQNHIIPQKYADIFFYTQLLYLLFNKPNIMEKYCKACGRVFKDSDFNICPYCGHELSEREGRQPIPRKLRHQVFQRDNYRCRECGATNKQTRLHVDHIVPVAKGGTNDLSNLQILCEACNKAKYTDEWVGGKKDKQSSSQVLIKTCPKCGGYIRADADKCKHCGSLLYDYKYFKPQVPINIKCPICGVLNKIDAIRCFNFK